MEKNLKLEDNIQALKWTGEVGISTIIQLVIGMPGETDETIFETIEFLKKISPYIVAWRNSAPSQCISINYAQALPGTPLYESAREHGLIGSAIDDEEQYLIQISDIDAYSQDHFVNHTGLPMLKVLFWRRLMLAHIDAHHFKSQPGGKKGLPLSQVVSYYFTLAKNKLVRTLKNEKSPQTTESGFFNYSRGLCYAPLLLNPVTRIFFSPIITMVVISSLKKPKLMIRYVFEYIYWLFNQNQSVIPNISKSLRKIVTIVPSDSTLGGKDLMAPLRKGR